MKKWVAKLGQGMARLAVWRKRGAAAAEAEASPAPTAKSNAAPTANPIPAPTVVAAPVAPVPVASSPAIATDELVDGLAELGDPITPQANSIDSLFTDGLAELGDLSAPMQNETMSADILYTENSTGGLAELDFIPEPEDEPASTPEQVAPEQTPIQSAAPHPGEASSATPNAPAGALAETSAPTPAAESDADPAAISRFQRLILGIRLFASRARQINLKGLGLKILGLKRSAVTESVLAEPALTESALAKPALAEPALAEPAPRLIGILSKKRVWIPGVSLALLAVIGSLTFMLVKASSEKAHLQADLTAAKKALKQAGAQTSVAVIPPLLAGSVPQADARSEHASPADGPAPTQLAAAETSIEPLRMARTSSPGDPVQMDCDVSSKASVAKNLKKCIEAFNQASGH